jgi:Flp pilus assembly protein TadD
MSRTPVPPASRAASAAVLALVLTAGSAAAQSAPQAPARRPATAEERATYERADPLSRSVFWATEQQLNPADPVAGVRLAVALREMGQFDRAAEAAQQTLLVQPANMEAMLELGRAHIARGQAFYGIAPLEQARALAPNDWRPLSLLGVAYQQVRRADDARAAWNAGLQLSPDNPAILANVGAALMTAGDPAGAETMLRRAVAQPGVTLQMRQNLALVLGLQGKTAEAEAIIRRDLPPEQADRNLAWLRAQTGGAPSTARTWGSLGG